MACKKMKVREYYVANRDAIQAKNRAYYEARPGLKKKNDAQYYAKNRDECRAKIKAYVAAHPERKRAADKAWYENNKDRHRAKCREYERTHAEHIAVMRRRAYAANPEARRAAKRAWVAANRERVRICKRKNQGKRRILCQQALTVVFSPDEFTARMDVFGSVCAYCRGPFQQVDHVKPIVLRGPHILANLRPSCKRCNQSKGRTPALKWLASLQRQTPLQLP